ncbi:MAG: InlB B-repeat-containing protein, partial [Bacteroidales bacterium]|nr:InlB B-repeat-containing protein [Bacteroidales bacterium]
MGYPHQYTICGGESLGLTADCHAEGPLLFSEGFSSVTIGSDASRDSSMIKLQLDEIPNFPICDTHAVFHAGGHLRFGNANGNSGGHITSIPMNLSQPYLVKMWIRGWKYIKSDGTEWENPWFFLAIDQDTVMQQSVPMGEWDGDYIEYSYVSLTGATSNSTITIGNIGPHQRFFLDSVAIVSLLPQQYLWSTGETTESITVAPATSTTYYVTVTADGQEVCVDTFEVVVQPSLTVTLDPCGGTCATAALAIGCQEGVVLPAAVPCADSLFFAGWSTEPVFGPVATTPVPLHPAGELYHSQTSVTLYAVYGSGAPDGGYKYRKVTEASDDWSGEYLIVYEEGSKIFDGSLGALDAEGNYRHVSIQNNTIAYDTTSHASSFTINPNNNGTYHILSASGYYIGQTSDNNGLKASNSIVYENNISFSNGDIDIICSGGAYLRYNDNSNNGNRFRYYKSSTYAGQKAIQLYRKELVAAHEYASYPSGCEQEDTMVFVLGNGVPATVYFEPGTGSCSDTVKTETEAGAGVTLPPARSCTEGYSFAGWTTHPVDSDTSIEPNPLYQEGDTCHPLTNSDTLYAVYKKCSGSLYYQLVNSDTSDWTGEYLIMAQPNFVLNGH